jgi:putative tryptophan/tyrosine transport system substrate-binding protein
MGARVTHRERRRVLLLAIAASPLLARAAPAPRKRIVFVGFAEQFTQSTDFDDIVRSVASRGFVDGREIEIVRVKIDPAKANSEKKGMDYLVPKIEREVLPLKPNVMLALGSIMARATHLATRTIPIVTSVSDPVDIGLAESIARPGGNVTGFSAGLEATSVKLLELMKLIIPGLARVAVFHEPRPMSTRVAAHYERAARGLGVEPVMVSSMDPAELVRALRSFRAKRIQAGIWAWAEGQDLAAREAIALRIPLVGGQEDAAEDGFFLSLFAFDRAPAPKLAAVVEQIPRGADPAGIPFQYPLTFRLVINRRTAKALGIAITPELLVRADRVID